MAWSVLNAAINLRHPDPTVTVDTHIVENWYSGGLGMAYEICNVQDTTDPTKRFPTFRHAAKLPEWRDAKSGTDFLLGVWMSYIMHETLELVTWQHTPAYLPLYGTGRILDPHDANDPRVRHIQDVVYSPTYENTRALVQGPALPKPHYDFAPLPF